MPHRVSRWHKTAVDGRNSTILRLAAGFFCLWLLAGCEGERPAGSLAPPGDAPDQILWDFTTTDSDSGRLRWVLSADQAQFFERAKQVEAQGLTVDIYGGDGSLSSTLRADSGRIDRKTGDMTVWSQVHVVSPEDYELHTSVLHWDRERELFHTEAFVEVRQKDNLYTGYEMECDQNLEHLRIQREPRGVIVGRDGELQP